MIGARSDSNTRTELELTKKKIDRGLKIIYWLIKAALPMITMKMV